MENKLLQGIGCLILAIVIIIIQLKTKGRRGVSIASDMKGYIAIVGFIILGIMLIVSYINNW